MGARWDRIVDGWDRVAEGASEAYERVRGVPGKVAAAPFKGASFAWNKSPAGLKSATVITAALAAGAGLLTYEAISGKKRGKRFNPDDTEVAQIPPLLTPQDLMLQPMMQDMNGPAEGRGEFEFRNRVLAGRGQQALDQPQLNAVPPRMSAIDPDAVRDLSAAKTTQAV